MDYVANNRKKALFTTVPIPPFPLSIKSQEER